MTLLGRLLELAAKQDLPAINWTVSHAGASLSGECLAHSHGDRMAQVQAWRRALGEPSTCREVDLSGGAVRLVAIWERRGKGGGSPLLTDRDGWQQATVVILATILPDLDEEEPGAELSAVLDSPGLRQLGYSVRTEGGQ